MASVDSATRVLANRYMLGRELGRGGMAVVHEAVDRRLDRRVAIKMVPVGAADRPGRDRFVREARAAARFFHPNVVAVFDAGAADGLLYIVMELVDGRTLADALAADGPVEPTRAGSIASSVLAALAAAHTAGIVHRDVKPSNIMVSRDGSVKLLDFGIARRLDDLAGSVTAAGEILGTPKYVAPEQITGRPATPATDLYAVGVVLYEMLTGRPPFVGETPSATARAHVHAPVPDVRALRDDVPVALARTIRTAMAKDPADRFSDAAEMQAALNGSTATEVDIAPRAVAPEPTQIMTAGRYRSARPPAWWLVGVAALVLAAGPLLWFLSRGGTGEPHAAASSTTLPATTVATTIEGVIAAFQADPDEYGREHTAAIIDELVKIQQGDNAGARAAALLETVRAWADSGDVTAAALGLLEPVLPPLIPPAAVEPDDADDAGNGDGNDGDGNVNGNNGNLSNVNNGNGNDGNNGNGNNGNNGNGNNGNGGNANGNANRGNGNGNGRNG